MIHLDAPDLEAKQIGGKHQLNLSLETRALLEETDVQISAFKLKYDKSFVVASGHLAGSLSKQKIKNASVVGRAQVDLTNIQSLVDVITPQGRPVPQLNGVIRADLQFEQTDESSAHISGGLDTEDVTVNGFVIGEMHGKGIWQDRKIKLSKLKSNNHLEKRVSRTPKLNILTHPMTDN